MSYSEGICNWCNRRSLLIRHDYVDGKFHHSCESCNSIAILDVSQFNRDELAQRSKMAESLPAY